MTARMLSVADGSKDPAHTEIGTHRARNLADVLRNAGIERIYSTDYRRALWLQRTFGLS
jgi:broad specificity phosphatase PhoE